MESKAFYLAANLNSYNWEISSKGMEFSDQRSILEFYALNINLTASLLYRTTLADNPIVKNSVAELYKLFKKHLYTCKLDNYIDVESWYTGRCKYYSAIFKSGINEFETISSIYTLMIEHPLTLKPETSINVGEIYKFSLHLKNHLNIFPNGIKSIVDLILAEK